MEAESDIVARVLAGDSDAFRGLVDAYSDRLYGFCLARLGDTFAAEDAVQDVLVRAYRSLRSYDPKRGFASWLFSIAANRVKTRYAASAMSARLVDRVVSDSAASLDSDVARYDPERLTLDALAAEELRAAVARLPRSYRAPVELYYFAGLSVADVAKSLRLKDEAVKSRLYRARKALLNQLVGSEGDGSTTQPIGDARGIHEHE